MMKKYWLLTLVVLSIVTVSFSSCDSKKSGAFTVTVSYRNLDKMTTPDTEENGPSPKPRVPGTPARIMLEEVPYGGDQSPIVLDSGTITSNGGKIVLKGSSKEESIFQLAIDKNPVLLVINDEKNINVDLDFAKQENYYSVSGSEATGQLKEFIKRYGDHSINVNKAFAELDSFKQLASSDSLVIVATEKKNNSVSKLNNYLREFISNTTHPALDLFALGWASRSFPQADFDKSLTASVIKFPEHNTLKSLKVTYEMQKAQMAEQNKKQENLWLGKAAPDLSLPDANGKMVSLSSFRGKYLLVDFWASWCGPCRQENPNVVKAYNMFKEKNFTILGVSLDKEKAPWLEAIKSDQLTWSHVSDLNYWNSKAVEVFGFDGIPYNILIDPQGKIIAENLRGFDLSKKLGEVLQ